MTAAGPTAEPGPPPAPRPGPADPTVRVARVPAPGRALPADRGRPPTPAPARGPAEEPTVRLAGSEPRIRQPTIEYGTPAPVRVVVSARPRARRRFRTWPWIAAVVVALLVLGGVLLVLIARGATFDGDPGLLGSDTAGLAVRTEPAGHQRSPSGAGYRSIAGAAAHIPWTPTAA